MYDFAPTLWACHTVCQREFRDPDKDLGKILVELTTLLLSNTGWSARLNSPLIIKCVDW